MANQLCEECSLGSSVSFSERVDHVHIVIQFCDSGAKSIEIQIIQKAVREFPETMCSETFNFFAVSKLRSFFWIYLLCEFRLPNHIDHKIGICESL